MKDINDCHKDFITYKSSFEEFKAETLTESDTRSKIIDKIFIDVLGWHETLIRREGYVIEGYYDYLFSIPNFQFVVEAKKTFVKFVFPLKHTALTISTFEKSNKDVVTQVRKYLFEMGLQYAVITNGVQFVVGKFVNSDGSDWRKNKCLIFNSFEDIEDRFVEFYNVLSFAAVQENFGFKIHLEESIQKPGKTILSSLPSKDAELVRNSLSSELTPIINHLFGELYDVDETINKELIKECFIENKEIKKNKSEIDKLFADLPPKVEKMVQARNTASIISQIKDEIEDDNLKFNQNPPNPIIIVGSKGAGKTTFINYLFKNDDEELIENHPYIYVDFRKYIGHKHQFEETIYSDIIDQIYEKYNQFNLSSFKALNAIYRKEILRNNESIWKHDIEKYGENGDNYQARLSQFLEEKIKNSEAHFFKLSEHLIKSRRIRLCIVIDNADQFETEVQKNVFLFAQSLNRKGHVYIIISLREGYYYKWRYLPPFDAFPCNVYHITAPPYREVLQKRITYALSKIELKGTSKGSVDKNKTLILNNDSVRKFLLSLQTSLFGSENSKMLDYLHETTYPNIREGLEVLKQFLISGHTEVHQYVLRQETSPDSKQPIPFWEFLKAVGLNSRKYYNHNISIINNLFYPTEGSRSHFLKIKILKFLDTKLTQGGISEKYINISELINAFVNTGYVSKYVYKELNELCRFRLIETENQISDVENISDLCVEESICISMKGHHYINSLVNEFSYIEMILEDTPIYDDNMYGQIKATFPLADDDGKRNLGQRVDVVEKFIAYLAQEEKSETIESEYFGRDIVQNIQEMISRDINRIKLYRNNNNLD